MITKREATLLDTEANRLLAIHEKGQHAALLNEVDELSKAGPLSPGVLGVASLALTAMERYDEATKAARAAAQRQPGWAWLHVALAAAQAGQGHLDQAIAAQRQAVRILPDEPACIAGLARYLRLAGKPAEALHTARQALSTAPEDPAVLNEMGLVLAATGDTAGALAFFRKAIQAAPDQPESYMNEGVLHLQAGARSEARQSLRKSLRLRPDLTEAEDRIAESLTGQTGVMRTLLVHVLNIGRVTLVGWVMIAFLYYLFFRLLEFLWRVFPAALPAGQALLLISLAYLLGGLFLGRLFRFAFRTGWPR